MSILRKTSFIFSTAALLFILVIAQNNKAYGIIYCQQDNNLIEKNIKEAEARYSAAQNKGNKEESAEAVYQLGMNWKSLLIYDKAGEYLIQSQKMFEELGNPKKIARNYLQLGELYRAIAEFEPSVEYLKKSIDLYEQEDDKEGIAKACDRIAATFYETVPLYPKRIDSLFLYITRALTISRELKKDSLTSSAMNILGAAYLLIKKNDIGIAHLNDALRFAESRRFNNDVALIKCNLAFGYYNKKEYMTSIELARQTYDYAEKRKLLPFIDISTLCLYMCYKALGDFQPAFKYLELYEDNRFKLYDENRVHRINALKIKYETEKKDIELAREKDMTFLRVVVFTLIITVAIAIICFYIYRGRVMKKRNAELEKKNALIQEQNVKLTELNATKDKFFSIIGHDLKNPYQSLIGFSSILIQDYKELTEEEIKEFIGYISEASETGNRLLQNLLDWSRAETGRLNYEPEQFYLYEIINEAIRLTANSTQQKEITIESTIPENQEVFCDRNMIYTVLRNLVSNAIKFSYRGGKIKISSEVKDSMIEIRVADSGVGMNESLMEDLFKLDKRITTDGTEHEKGTGLGLYLCKEFVEKNHGSISVISEPGKGSTFCFNLPVKK